MNERTGQIERSTEFGLKRRKARSEIGERGCSLTPRLFFDAEHSEDEERFILLGMSSVARVLVVVHCYRQSEEIGRIISARKATKSETRFYEEAI